MLRRKEEEEKRQIAKKQEEERLKRIEEERKQQELQVSFIYIKFFCQIGLVILVRLLLPVL